MRVRVTGQISRWSLSCLTAAVALTLGIAGLGGGPPARAIAQEATPAASPVAADEPAAPLAVGEEIRAEAPHEAVIAQGLAFLDGTPQVWTISEFEVESVVTAAPVSSSWAFILQRTGRSVVRNEVTVKRTMIEPGEAYYKSADDPYTTYQEGEEPSAVWVFEIVAPDAAAEDAFYVSPELANLPEGNVDLEMVRTVLLPGESATIPPHNGPALVMATVGTVDAVGAEATPLAVGDVVIAEADLTLTNAAQEPAAFVVVLSGDVALSPSEVAEEEAAEAEATAQVEQAAAIADDAATLAEDDPDGDEDGDGLTNAQEVQLGTDPFTSDADGDGLPDGQEVLEFNTDPTVADTDGDGVSDGDEINIEGTDPNDAASVPGA